MARASHRYKKQTAPDMHAYWQSIREKVCTRCVDGDGHGNCRLDVSIDCPLQMYLPRIIQMVRNIRSDSMEIYIRELRLITCAECGYQTVTGNCRLREDVDCALDRYFPLIIEAIEAVDTASRRSKSHLS